MEYILLEINTDSDWDCLGYKRALIKYDATIDSTLKTIINIIKDKNSENDYVNNFLNKTIKHIDKYDSEISVEYGNYSIDTTLVKTINSEYGLQLLEVE